MKNIIIAALVGISFLTSGFWVGLRFAPMPKKPAPAVTKVEVKTVDPKVAFSIETLKRTTENMASVNDALQAREQALMEREKKAAQKEDEIAAERAALDRLHAHFKQLYGEFRKRLQLVTDSDTAAMQRQVTIYGSMDPAQSVDLIRALDDSVVTRLFVMMEDKPLARIVGVWKQKYPADAPRLLADLNGMGRVVAKDKIDLPSDSPDNASGIPVPPTTTDVTPPVSTPDSTAAAPTTPDANTAAPTPANPAPAANPAVAAPANDGAISGHEPYANEGTPPPNIGTPDAPAASAPADPDLTAPPPSATATPAATPSDSVAPPPAPAAPDAAPAPPTPAAPTSSTPASASTTGESSLLDSPGETAAKASTTGHDQPGNNAPSAPAPAPAEFIPTTPTMRLAHDKPARFASARNN